MSSTLVIFVEGNDDERFFRKVIVPRLAKRYSHVRLLPYAQRRARRTSNILRAMQEMRREYLFVADFDYGPTIRERVEDLCHRYPPLNPQRVLIVRREIEGWYLAGLDDSAAADWGLHYPLPTDALTKEEFNELVPPQFYPRIVFMRAILDHYSLERGIERNTSLGYFDRRFRLTST